MNRKQQKHGTGGQTMPTKLTLEAAIIELNRLKSQERMDIDRERLAAAVDVLKDAAQFRIKRMLVKNEEGGFECSACGTTIDCSPVFEEHFCYNCGQKIDWGRDSDAPD
jgi:Zn finger protein HypA/HybF involved in hydrogenase expression